LQIEDYWKLGGTKDEQNILSPVTYSPIRRLLPRRGSVVTKSETNKKRCEPHGQMNKERTNDEQMTNDERTKDEQ